MYLLGIHDGHNASAALMKDGVVTDAIQEERFNKIKNFGGFPEKSVEYLLKKNGLTFNDINQYVFASEIGYWLGLENRDRVLKKYKMRFNSKLPFFHNIKILLKRFIPNFLINHIRGKRHTKIAKIRCEYFFSKGVKKEKIHFLEHHLCHASSAAYGSGNQNDTLVVTLVSSGDYSSGSVSIFSKGGLKKILDIPSDDSLGRLYSYVTYYLGMVPLEHEYKIMGLAPYSENSKYSKDISKIFESMYYFDNDISFKISKKIGSAKNLGKFITEGLKQKRFDNVSAGLQIFLEKFVCKWIEKLVKHTKIKKIALAGGIFMNVKLNKKISELDCIDSIFIFPSCGDETNPFGALYRRYFEITKEIPEKLTSFYLGNDYKNEEIKNDYEKYIFKNFKTKITFFDDIEKKVSELIFQDKIVARFKGRMEFGARSLGNRAILCNASNTQLVQQINNIIKNRDFWMPFAPSLINEKVLLNNPKNILMDYMIIASDFKKEYQNKFQAVVHPYDQSCRPNVVSKDINGDYYKLIEYYSKLSGHGVILNTSFNLHGLPIVSEPKDAFNVFDNSGLKYLAIENYLIEKLGE